MNSLLSESRYECPLDCGWFLDASMVDLSDPDDPTLVPLIPTPPANVDPFAFGVAILELMRTEAAIRAHMESHSLLELVTALIGARRDRDIAQRQRDELAKAVRSGLAAAALILEES